MANPSSMLRETTADQIAAEVAPQVLLAAIREAVLGL